MSRHKFIALLSALVLFGTLSSVEASNVGIFGRSLGSKCGLENEEIVQLGGKGGTQMCVMTSKGLIWQDSTYLVANQRLVKTLPNCGVNRFFKVQITSALAKTLSTVATSYFQKQNLLPIKIDLIYGVTLPLNSIGLHPCSNGLGVAIGGWSGSIPSNAKVAWLLAVTHKTNEFGNFLNIYIAQLGGRFVVVGAGTGP